MGRKWRKGRQRVFSLPTTPPAPYKTYILLTHVYYLRERRQGTSLPIDPRKEKCGYYSNECDLICRVEKNSPLSKKIGVEICDQN